MEEHIDARIHEVSESISEVWEEAPLKDIGEYASIEVPKKIAATDEPTLRMSNAMVELQMEFVRVIFSSK
jgi:hypothetical protein